MWVGRSANRSNKSEPTRTDRALTPIAAVFATNFPQDRRGGFNGSAVGLAAYVFGTENKPRRPARRRGAGKQLLTAGQTAITGEPDGHRMRSKTINVCLRQTERGEAVSRLQPQPGRYRVGAIGGQVANRAPPGALHRKSPGPHLSADRGFVVSPGKTSWNLSHMLGRKKAGQKARQAFSLTQSGRRTHHRIRWTPPSRTTTTATANRFSSTLPSFQAGVYEPNEPPRIVRAGHRSGFLHQSQRRAECRCRQQIEARNTVRGRYRAANHH